MEEKSDMLCVSIYQLLPRIDGDVRHCSCWYSSRNARMNQNSQQTRSKCCDTSTQCYAPRNASNCFLNEKIRIYSHLTLYIYLYYIQGINANIYWKKATIISLAYRISRAESIQKTLESLRYFYRKLYTLYVTFYSSCLKKPVFCISDWTLSSIIRK